MANIRGGEVFAGAVWGLIGLSVLRWISYFQIIGDDPELWQEMVRLNELNDSAGNVVFDSGNPAVGEHYEKTMAQWRTETDLFDQKVMSQSYLGQGSTLQWTLGAVTGAGVAAGVQALKK